MKARANSLSLPLLYQPGAKMVTASKATVPTISDQASAMQLSQCAKNLASALAELRTASQKVVLSILYDIVFMMWTQPKLHKHTFKNYTARAPEL